MQPHEEVGDDSVIFDFKMEAYENASIDDRILLIIHGGLWKT